MRHFPVEDWIDYVRRVDGSGQRAAIQKHLDEGCSKCLKTIKIWRGIVILTKDQSQNAFEPPAGAVQAVQANFALRKVVPFSAGKLEVAKLVFDSTLQPLAVGVRGSPAVRHLLYKSGEVCIDVHTQPKPGSDSVVLIGQLHDSTKPDRGISGIPVSLLCDGDTVSRGRTNDVGEFDFGLTALDHLQLVFGVGGSRTIVVPVPDGHSARGLS
jgi:hypothetical protein